MRLNPRRSQPREESRKGAERARRRLGAVLGALLAVAGLAVVLPDGHGATGIALGRAKPVVWWPSFEKALDSQPTSASVAEIGAEQEERLADATIECIWDRAEGGGPALGAGVADHALAGHGDRFRCRGPPASRLAAG